jgi:hypothetical protein
MQTIQLSQLKQILTFDVVYSVPKIYEVTVMLGVASLKVIRLIDVGAHVEIVDTNYNHYLTKWDAVLEAVIYKKSEHYLD